MLPGKSCLLRLMLERKQKCNQKGQVEFKRLENLLLVTILSFPSHSNPTRDFRAKYGSSYAVWVSHARLRQLLHQLLRGCQRTDVR